MSRVRVSTTVEESLLEQARACCGPVKDSLLIEQALRALLDQRRAVEYDQRIEAAYREIALDAPDEWGSLEGFLDAAGASRHAAEPR